MGLSSSQARLLSLTGRMHDIEYKAQNLQAQKLQMANESRHVYQEYENALNATKIQLKQIGTDGMITWFDASVKRMKDAGYTVALSGAELYHATATEAANFVEAAGNPDYFAALQLGRVTDTNRNVDGVIEIYNVAHFEDMLTNMSPGKKYRLMANIDASSVNSTLLGKSVSQIELDGNGFTISNLSNSLFGNVYKSKISNLSLNGTLNVSGTSDYTCGILANTIQDNSHISHVAVSGTINATGADGKDIIIGGLSGLAVTSITFDNCSSDVAITTTDCRTVGGLLGQVYYNTQVKNSESNSKIDVNGYTSMVGGVVGNTYQSTYTNILSNTSIDVTGLSGGAIGGLAGSIKADDSITIIDNASVTGDIIGIEASSVGSNGAIIGHGSATAASPTGQIKVSNSYANLNGSDFTNPSKEFIHSYDTGIDYQESSVVSAPAITVEAPARTTDITAVPGYAAEKALFNKMAAGYTVTPSDEAAILATHEDDTNWFTEMVNAGLLFMSKDDGTGNMVLVNVATDVNLQEVQDKTNLRKAEVKYEADMRRIDAKDKKYDVDLAAIDNERNAIKTEMETLKTVAKDNVDRTFKLFS